MQVHIRSKPSYAAAFCVLEHGEGLYATPGSMMAMSAGITAQAGIGGGSVAKAAMRSKLGGESFFMARYRAGVDHSWVALAPKYPGDVEPVEVSPGEPWLVEAGALLGCSDTLDVAVRYAGARMALMREGLTMLGVSGQGTALLSSYGGVVPLDLDDVEELVVDTGHLVAFTHGVTMKLSTVGGVMATVVSGEGLVAHLRGPGRVLLQTRAETQLRDWLLPAQAEQGEKR